MTNINKSSGGLNFSLIIVRSVLVIVILVVGVVLMSALSAMKAKPDETLPEEVVAQVIGKQVFIQDFESTLFGYGTTKPHQLTEIIPEVGGKIVQVHPDLEVGNIIPQGELLFQIDPTNYEIALAQAEANLRSAEATVRQLEIQHQQDVAQLDVSKRMLAISQNDFERFTKLFQDNNAESARSLETAEMNFIREEEKLIQIQGRVNQHPADLASAKASVRSAEAQYNRAEVDLQRTQITAPFNARIVMKALELNQLVSANAPVLELADDSILEVVVSMDSAEVAQWLKLTRDQLKPQWFEKFTNYPVKLEWTTNPEQYAYVGNLDRVQRFNPENRTFELVVQVSNANQPSQVAQEFPLTDGMFCRVHIPGKVAQNVIAVPRSAVDSQNIIYTSVDNRLRSQEVEIARIEKDTILISKGLQDGDIILTKRPPASIDGMKLVVKFEDEISILPVENEALENMGPSFPVSKYPEADSPVVDQSSL